MNIQAADVKRYNKSKLVVSLVGGAISFLLTIALLISGYTLAIEQFAYSFSSNIYLVLIMFSGAFGLISGVVSFPFSFYSGFILEHTYELSNQTFIQ